MTPEDVIFSIEALKKNSPMYSSYYRHVTKYEKTGELEVTFTFDSSGNRELPTIVGELLVLPKHWWEGKDASGQPLPEGLGYRKVNTTLKHFAANNSEYNRLNGSSDMDDRTLREYYTAQFRRVVRSSHPASMMTGTA